jgi:UDP-N-acetylglucosamine 2-epimerase (non-hydrolysing)
LIWTGQHPRLDPANFRLGEIPRLDLACPGAENPHLHVAAVSRALLPLLAPTPDLIIVQGDTSSALGAARAGFTAGIAVAHVEAGLRTHDPSLPWPEEEYRTAIDADADLLFAPTEIAAANLRAEKVRGAIHVTGNSGIDALLESASRLSSPSVRDSARPRLLVTCHRRESWRDGLASIAGALVELAGQGADVEFVLHPNAFVATRMRRLLDGARGIHLLDPCDHEELLRRMRDSDLVLSDSGGMQEEAPALGVPLLVLRDKTERPEGIAAGSSRLVGTDRQRIVAEVRSLLDAPAVLAAMSRPALPFGDGRAGPRIAAIIVSWLQQRPLTRRLA